MLNLRERITTSKPSRNSSAPSEGRKSEVAIRLGSDERPPQEMFARLPRVRRLGKRQRAVALVLVEWRQELAQTPFERYFREALTGVVLDSASDGTRVELRMVRKLRGLARFGSLQMRRAMRRELDTALEHLEQVTV